MNPPLRPRLLAPAESAGDHAHSGPTPAHSLALDVMREAIARLPACRSLSELFGILHHCARQLQPSIQAGFMLRQPDACFELVFCSPITSRDALRSLTEQLIESGQFAQALKQGNCRAIEVSERHCVLQSLATPRRVYGMAVWLDRRIPQQLQQPLATLVDLAALSLDRFQGGAEAFLMPPSVPRIGSSNLPGDDIAYPADQLTGLAHRTHFMRFLKRAIQNRPATTEVGAILLDVDGFHRVNREFGCETGDRILREMAHRLDAALRSQFLYDSVGVSECDLCFARTGADEFGLAVARMRYPHRLKDLAIHLHSHLSEGFRHGTDRLYLSLSIGVASTTFAADQVSAQTSSAQTLLRSADSALKRAKVAGRNQHVVFEPMDDEIGSTHLRTESLLQEALRKDQFSLHFQPLFRLTDMVLVGAEALVRLQLEDGAPLPPSDFIPIAESSGQIAEIGEWVLRQTCRQIRSWDALDHKSPPIAVNVSAIELSDPKLSRRMRRILEEERIEPERVHVEITETAIARNEDQALTNIKALRDAGIEVWIDDFGTGYSSLKSLKNFPISGVKLDREFVKDLADNTSAEVIASTILTMAKKLSYPVVAEGIETATQFLLLKQYGCTCGQGYHLGRPVEPEIFRERHLGAPPRAPSAA